MAISSFEAGQKAYLVGIKGTGMSALAEILQARGLDVCGSDVEDEFYTDQILKDRNIPFFSGFHQDNLPDAMDFAVYSAAYSAACDTRHPELAALNKRGIPLVSYPEALGLLSREISAGAVAGVHGKTTTAALCGCLAQALRLPGTVLVGSAVPALGDRCTFMGGQNFFLAETCEYKRHFLHFSPDRLVLTSVEADHLDYFRDEGDVEDAFVEFIQLLPRGGTLIFCRDDPGARRTARRILREREDLKIIPYGFSARGMGRLVKLPRKERAENSFTLGNLDAEFRIRIPGDHVVQDAGAALLLIMDQMGVLPGNGISPDLDPRILRNMEKGIRDFTGSRRRAEIVGEENAILIMDDYAHHPSAVGKTLEGLKDFYPERRLVVDFMSHTYSRTAALLEDFAASFGAADAVILHKIYASAREGYNGKISGRDLYVKCLEHHPCVKYYEEPLDALDYLVANLKAGDLFITMGAGDNWQLGRRLLEKLKRS